MKLTIDIPEEFLQNMVQDIAVARVKQILNEWSVSDRAKAAILNEWREVESRICSDAFSAGNILRVEKTAVENILREFEARLKKRVNRTLQEALRDEAPEGGEGVTNRGSGSRTKRLSATKKAF